MKYNRFFLLLFSGLVIILIQSTCNKIEEFINPDQTLSNQLPAEAKQAADILLSSLNIPSTSQILINGPIAPGTILKEDKPDTLNPVELIIPNSSGPYYVFFIDDEPKMNYYHSMRYAYVNLASGETVWKDASYWMTLYPPNQTLRPFELKAYEKINDVLFIMVEGEGAAALDRKLDCKQLLTSTGIDNDIRNYNREGDCKKIAFTFDMGERERGLWQAIIEFAELLAPWEDGGRGFDDKANDISEDVDLMDKWLSDNDFDVRRYSNYSGNKGKFEQITKMAEFDEVIENIGRELTFLEPPDCCHELFIFLLGHGNKFGSG